MQETIKQWLDHLAAQGKSRHTIAAYRRALTHFEGWNQTTYGDAFDPTAVIGRDLADWKAHQQTVERAAPSTVNQRLVALGSFYNWCQARGITAGNPTSEIQTIRLNKRQPKSLSRKELRRLLRAVHQVHDNDRDVAIVEMLVGTGLRVEELLNLKVGDIEMGERSGKVTVRQGKNGGYREVPLTAVVRRALAAYLKREHRTWEDTAVPLWWGTRGTLKSRSTIFNMLAKYCLKAGIESVGPHILRHTFATEYLRANPDDLRGLAALLGHSHLNTVMIYTEPSLDDLADRMERIEIG